jgi:hypothetical protein
MPFKKSAGLRRFVCAAAFAVLALGAAPMSSAADVTQAVPEQDFTAQARAEGLTGAQAKELQATVDDYIVKHGGKQVAANKVQLGGADFYVVLPGEEVARDLDTRVPMSACQYTDMCAWSSPNFQGSLLVMHDCGRYEIDWIGTGSWDNNQTTGTAARFLNSAGVVGYTSPPAHSLDLSAGWSWVYWVINC